MYSVARTVWVICSAALHVFFVYVARWTKMQQKACYDRTTVGLFFYESSETNSCNVRYVYFMAPVMGGASLLNRAEIRNQNHSNSFTIVLLLQMV